MMSRFFRPGVLSSVLVLCLAAMPAPAQTVTPETLIPRAKAGEADAQTALAFLYHEGNGVAQNFATAAEWARRAAEAGDPDAQNLLGRYHHGGFGVEQDQAEALRWLSAAAQTGQPQFLYDLGQALEYGADGSTDPATAAQAYTQAAEAGHLEAAVSLGLLYQEGRGVAQNFAQAHALYEQAASQGHARALNNLGLLYVRGDGVGEDYEQAAQLFAAAAKSGLPDALRNLGVMYENGFGVPLNEAHAAELYRQAGGQGATAAQQAPVLRYDERLVPLPDADPGLQDRLRTQIKTGDPVAQFQLGWHLINAAEPDFTALSEAAALFQAAAQTGYGPAMRNLGLLYFEGRGVPQDYVLGRMWLTLAAQAGQTDATELIEVLGAAMTPEQINEAQARVMTLGK